MAIDFKALAAKAVATGADQTKAQVGGGGDYTPPAAGPGLARLVAYVEVGKQKSMMKGKEQVNDKVLLVFELCGKRHPPTVKDDGTKIPYRIEVEVNHSLNEKAHFFKLFQRMNYRQDAQHMAQLLTEAFKVEVIHREWKGKDGKPRISAELQGPDGFHIYPPRKEDEDSESGWVTIDVPAAISEPRCFLWDHADLEQWASLFIDGEYPERKDESGKVVAKAKSKNVLQNRIKNAVNFVGSPIHQVLVENGTPLDIPDVGDDDDMGDDNPASGAEPAATKPAGKDALAGIV